MILQYQNVGINEIMLLQYQNASINKIMILQHQSADVNKIMILQDQKADMNKMHYRFSLQVIRKTQIINCISTNPKPQERLLHRTSFGFLSEKLSQTSGESLLLRQPSRKVLLR